MTTIATTVTTIAESSKEGVFLLWDNFYESSPQALSGTSNVATNVTVTTLESSLHG